VCIGISEPHSFSQPFFDPQVLLMLSLFHFTNISKKAQLTARRIAKFFGVLLKVIIEKLCQNFNARLAVRR
jgi:hypothetical protein